MEEEKTKKEVNRDFRFICPVCLGEELIEIYKGVEVYREVIIYKSAEEVELGEYSLQDVNLLTNKATSRFVCGNYECNYELPVYINCEEALVDYIRMVKVVEPTEEELGEY